MDAFTHYKKIEVDEDALPEVDEAEVARHNTPEDLWVVIYGKVYDVTEWQHSHPGGDFILQEYGGRDASEMFRSVQHSPDANGIRSNFMVARLKKKTKVIVEKPLETPQKVASQKRSPPPKPPSLATFPAAPVKSKRSASKPSLRPPPPKPQGPAQASPAKSVGPNLEPVKQTKVYAVVDTKASAPLKRKVGPVATVGSNKAKL